MAAMAMDNTSSTNVGAEDEETMTTATATSERTVQCALTVYDLKFVCVGHKFCVCDF